MSECNVLGARKRAFHASKPISKRKRPSSDLFARIGSASGWRRTKRVSIASCQNATFWAQERELFMRRNRFQKGSVRPRKHGCHKVWVAQWWEGGQKKSLPQQNLWGDSGSGSRPKL